MSATDVAKHFVVATVSGFIFGGIAGLIIGIGIVASVDQSNHDYAERKTAVRGQCLAGNVHACRVYEVDYSRGGL